MALRMDGTEANRTAERLARALRSGLELRWSLPQPSSLGANPFPPLGNVRSFLEPDADSIHLHLPPRGRLLFRIVRVARSLARKLIAPWLLMQSRFNFAAISVVEQIEQRVRALEEAERALRQTIQTLEKTLLSRVDHESLSQSDSPKEEFRRCSSAGVSERVLEPIFIHMHLPCPPARLLSLGCGSNTSAIEMASLGFQVVGIDARPLPLRHPNFTMVPARLDRLPFEDECFDGVVGLLSLDRDVSDEQAVAEVFRVLKRGGRFLLTVPFGRPSVTRSQRIYDRAQLDRLLSAFRVVERGYGIHEGDAWTFTYDEKRAEQSGGENLSVICLLVLEKP